MLIKTTSDHVEDRDMRSFSFLTFGPWAIFGSTCNIHSQETVSKAGIMWRKTVV